MLYTKQELDKATKDLVELCKYKLSIGEKRIVFKIKIDGEELECYLDCEVYINSIEPQEPKYDPSKWRVK